jgi:hypothetical protein
MYGDQIRFRVVRDGEPVGTHVVTFTREGGALNVEVAFSLRIDALVFTLYRYDYRSQAVWRDGCLKSLHAAIDDDGERYTVDVRRTKEGLTVSGPLGTDAGPLDLFPTNHWHPGVRDSERVINTLTGRINDVRVVDRGQERVIINGIPEQPARHYAYTGELTTEAWYDAAGRWVKMRFAGKDGSAIELICEQCAAVRSAVQ